MPHGDTKLRKPKTQSKLRKTAIIAGVYNNPPGL